jgi:hypothetical protein
VGGRQLETCSEWIGPWIRDLIGIEKRSPCKRPPRTEARQTRVAR